MSQVSELIHHIKRRMKQLGITYSDLSEELSVAESSLKRWFSKNSFNIERLDDICRILHMDLIDLLPKQRSMNQMKYLNEGQELELATDEKLMAIFYLAISGVTSKIISQRMKLEENKARSYFIKLDHLELIELHPGDRIVPLVNQSVRWLTDGPLNEKYGREIRHDFMDTAFEGQFEKHWLISGRLSKASLDVLSRKQEALISEMRDLMDLDANLEPNQTSNITFFAAHRPWVLPLFKKQNIPK